MQLDSVAVKPAQGGFTLIELMIAVAVIAILSSIAYSSYNAQTTKARRTDAQSALMGLAQAMERRKTVTGGYTGAAAGGANTGAPTVFATQSPLDGATKFYDLSIEAVNGGTSFTVRATPIAGSAQDGDGYLEYLSTGIRRWDRNDDDDTADANESCWQATC
ncbi:prepilin-type N-terminal cleavage/methylation domain-containing protein [Proteobacteria bacterium 005FR1]|nr:prepilin-type N-terminal cleavage/methylation domain-containing protein [Proteobacteria bacterium 005FR1]